MTVKLILSTGLSFFVAVIIGSAQEPAGLVTGEGVETGAVHDSKNTNALTLADALILAEQRNLNLLVAQEERKIADGKYIEFRSHALPQLSLQAQYMHLDDVTTVEMEGGSFQLGQLDNYEAAAKMSQSLYSGGALQAALRMGKEGQAIASRRTDHARSELAYQVHALFNGTLLAKENVIVSREAVRTAEQNLRDVTAQLKQGLARKFDLLRAKEQVSSRKADSIAADNGLHKSRLRLFQVSGIPLNDKRSINGVLQYEPMDLSVSNAVTGAIANRNDIAAANHAVELQRNAIALAKSTGHPQVGLFGETKYANPDRSFNDEWETSWMVGVRATLPIFDGSLTKGKVLQEEARLRQAKLKLENLLSLVKLNVAQASVDIETTEQLVEARKGNVAEATEALRLARRGYDEGILQQIDVLNTQLSLSDSQQKYIEAVFRHVMAKRQLERVTGTLVRNVTERRK